MSGFVVAADLDRTLIFSTRAVGTAGTAGLVAVETADGRPCSFVTPAAARSLTDLVRHPAFVLVTSRSEEQVLRTALPGGLPHRVLCANGARLLVDGRPDRRHESTWAERLSGHPGGEEIAASTRAALSALDVTAAVRVVAETFAVARFGTAAEAGRCLARLRAVAAGLGAEAVITGRKVYLLPDLLDKAAALSILAGGDPTLAAAGDSVLDLSMLAGARDALVPAGSELARAGGHLTTARGGVAAGEEIAAWLGRSLEHGSTR